ncbi:cobalt ABC transporter ATPase component, CbiO [Streptococcus pneumoniae]|nr:cobalt ABC transporter ATPase component, CbiO [Streptococcus pneumoniae]
MVEIKSLSLDYGEEHILDDISLSIAEGRVRAIYRKKWKW